MPYKSIQGRLVLGLALAALGAGAAGAPAPVQAGPAASQATRPEPADAIAAPRTPKASAGHIHPERARALVERERLALLRYTPLSAADLATHSIDGAPATVALRGAVGDGRPLRYSLAMAPRHGTVSIQGGRATYTPDPGFEGVDTYTYRVQAGEDSAEAMVAVTAIGRAAAPAERAAAL